MHVHDQDGFCRITRLGKRVNVGEVKACVAPEETQNRGRNSGATSSVFSATDTVFKLAFSIGPSGNARHRHPV